MPIQLQASQVIDRPVEVVFDFLVRDHIRNHPRWDPDIELEQVSEGPIRIGTLIHRRNSRSGTPVEGTMEVIEFEPDRAFGTLIHDGPVEMRGRTTFEALDANKTSITIHVELPGMDEASVDKDFLAGRMERSARNMKKLIETEIPL